MGLAELFAAVQDQPLGAAAAQLAESGVPVFPCVRGGKRPLVEHGFREATISARQVASWWRRWPAGNIGVPTGGPSGLEVVDVDQKQAGSGFRAFERFRGGGLVPGWLAVVRTPSGGAHFYFPADAERAQPSWQAAQAHVDFRGEGGYVIVPPSTFLNARRPTGYELAGPAQPHVAAVDARALRDFLDPRPEPTFRRPRPGTGPVEAAERLARWVSALGEGERNRGLFWAACRLAEAGVAPSVTLDALGPAAEQIGLPPREVVTTIRSAYRANSAVPARTAASARGHGEAPRGPVRAEGQVLS